MLPSDAMLYARRVYTAIRNPVPLPADPKICGRIKLNYDEIRIRPGRTGTYLMGVWYTPGQRPKGIVTDVETVDRWRESFYERGEVTAKEFARLAGSFNKRIPSAVINYMTHPRIIADIREWFQDVRPVKGRYRTAKDAAVALQTYLRARRWPVVVQAPLIERLFKLAGFEKNNYGWAVAFRYG